MRVRKFVSYDVPALEVVKTAPVPLALEKAENGNTAPFKALYKSIFSIEQLETPLYRLHGWEFHFDDLCRRYWVKLRYYGIQEFYAPNKSCIYAVLGRHNVIECLEVVNKKCVK